ncbi:MAG: hypothetical protein AABX28_01620 [Nanoarchaeota archaeon]
MDYAFSEKRNKRKDKRKERKKHPYKQGGRRRVNVAATPLGRTKN